MIKSLRHCQTILIALVLSFLATRAHAQKVSVYVTSANTHLYSVFTGATYNPAAPTGYTGQQFANFWTSGIGAGVTCNLRPVGRITVAADLRGSTKQGTPGADTALLGLRFGLRTNTLRWRPYLQGSLGYLGTRTVNLSPNPPAGATPTGGKYVNEYAPIEFMAGLDYRFTRRIDLRLVEVGGGQATSTSRNLSGAATNLLTVNSGVVVHF
jgi:hypothetical protein